MNIDTAQTLIQSLINSLSSVVMGKTHQIELLIIALMSQGHVLLEDVPGVGKTTLAKAFAISTGCKFSRIQFTPDLLPSDVIGTSLYNTQESKFYFKEGPVFTNILMADEINRASPRTQSSLLEAMAEQQVTVDGQSRSLNKPFVVIATQNPVEYHGTYPLPEAQLDRFSMSFSMGYPEPEHELKVLFSQEQEHPVNRLKSVASIKEIIDLQELVKGVKVSEDLGKYLIKLVTASREHPSLQLGISPRGSLMLFQAIKAHAILRQRQFVIPDDIKILAIPVLAHRLILETKAKYSGVNKQDIVEELLEQVPVPR